MTSQELLDRLVDLRISGPKSPCYGICFNAAGSRDDQFDVLFELHKRFRILGVDETYPVLDSTRPDKDGQWLFDYSGDSAMWDSRQPYGAARWALLDQLIELVRGEL